jgi:hypothetical protein
MAAPALVFRINRANLDFCLNRSQDLTYVLAAKQAWLALLRHGQQARRRFYV